MVPYNLCQFPSSVKLRFNTTRMDKKPSLDVISNDILVDIMSNYLDVHDVLALRQVRTLLLRRGAMVTPTACR